MRKFRVSSYELRVMRPLAVLWLLVVGYWPFRTSGADDIPPLVPPLPEIQPSLMERFGWILWILLPLLMVLATLGIWLASRPGKPPVLPAPAAQARRELTALQSQPENGAVLSQISRALRRYLINTFWLPPHEMTTSDFCRLLAAQERIGPALAGGLGEFLRACDERKFAPATIPPPLGAAGRALELVDLVESARVRASNLAQTGQPA